MRTIGRHVFGLGAITLGIPGLLYGDFAALGLPVPPHLPGYSALLYASAALLVLAGLAIQLPRTAAIASLALAAFFAAWTLGLHVPRAVTQPTVWVSWEAIAETMVMALGGLLAWVLIREPQGSRARAVARYAVPLFGAGLIVFGTSEFVYARFTASLVPAWLPPSQLVWTYATGAAHIAAGLAISSGVRARLAAVLLTAMYLGFALLVHLPRVVADPSGMGVWAENGVNLVLTGAAWILAEYLAGKERR